MNPCRPAVKRREVGNHGIPVVLGERRRILSAVLDEITGTAYLLQAFCRTVPAFCGRTFDFRQDACQLLLRVFALWVKGDAGHFDGRLLLAVLKSGQTHDARFVHAHGIAAKMLDEPLLYLAKAFHFGARIHEVVDMQGFLRLDHHGGRQGKGIDLFLLFFKGAIVHLEELRIDSRNRGIVLPTVVDHEEDAPLHGIVVLERFLDAFVLPALAGQLRASENTRLLVLEYAKADRIGRIEERTENICHRYIHVVSSLKYRSVFFHSFASLISSAMPRDISPNTQTSSHIRRSARPNISPISRSSKSLSSSICG